MEAIQPYLIDLLSFTYKAAGPVEEDREALMVVRNGRESVILALFLLTLNLTPLLPCRSRDYGLIVNSGILILHVLCFNPS